MARKSESAQEREARARLKERYDAEAAAYGAYFAVLARREELQVELEGLDAEQIESVAAIAAVSTVDRTAELVGWSKVKVRDAVKSASVPDSPGGGVDTAAEVAS